MKHLSGISLILISGFAVLALSACQTGTAQTPPSQGAISNVEVPTTRNSLIIEGEAVPVNHVTLSFPVTGVVEEVTRIEGENVEKGDVIALLKGTEKQKAAVSAAQAELTSARHALDDLVNNANVARAEVQLRMAKAKKDLDKAIENRNYKNYKRADQWLIDQAQADYILALSEFNNAETVWSNWRDKDDTDKNRAFALQNFAAARKKVEQAEASYNYLMGSPEEVDVLIAEGELVVAKANYEKAEEEWELVKNGPNQNDLLLAQERLDNATAQLDAAQAALKDLDLEAPFSGTIVTSNLKVGQISSVGSSSVVLADLSTFQVESSDLTELNINRIEEEDSVNVTFDGIPGLSIPGTVQRINPLGQDNQGDITYSMVIKLKEQDPRIKWRLTASLEFPEK
ncbi:MAG: HlyD family efflux transporter periplasmic adaptor subunit [Leptolinea sp.]|nr:HlyD family efflux transporter periplasmic adaptor subunit [Leptolinea sp.]